MRYIIKKHYEATESNENFKGEIFDYYLGINNSLLSENEMPAEWKIEKYGFTTLAGAKAGMRHAQSLADWEVVGGNWNVTVELIQIQ